MLGVEWAKLRAQPAPRAVLVLCAGGPFLFATAMRVQSALPTDTLFGRAANESGFATPLIVLGFGGLWVLPAIGSLVAGDLFASEERHGTWPALLTRSCTRTEVFTGKVLAA